MKHPGIKLAFFLVMLSLIGVVNFYPVSACKATAAVNYETVKKQLTTSIESQMQAFNVTGLSIALVDDQETVWSRGFGKADLESGIDATADSIFLTASISKLFTATAIMRLVEQGKISLDQPLETYLPEFRIKSHFPQSRNITLRSILTHHSGLPDGHLHGEFSDDPEYQFPSILDALKDEYVCYPPNYIYAYSNLGFVLLGEVIERVTKKKFIDYMESEILKPLGMIHSSFAIRDDMRPYLTKSYIEGTKPYNAPRFRDLPDGGLYSNVIEMSKFISMVFANGRSQTGSRILSQETLTNMLTPQNYGVPLDFGQPIGLSWFLTDYTGKLGYAGKTACHDGKYIGYSSSLLTLPEHKLGVIVLTNSATGGLIANNVAAETLRLALEAKTGRKAPEAIQKVLPERTLTPAERQWYTGYYGLGNLGMFLEIKPKGGSLSAKVAGQEYELHYHEGRWFSSPGLANIYFKITEINNLKVVIMKPTSSDYITVIGEGVSAKPLPEAWQKRLGNYQVVNDPYRKATFTPELFVSNSTFAP